MAGLPVPELAKRPAREVSFIKYLTRKGADAHASLWHVAFTTYHITYCLESFSTALTPTPYQMSIHYHGHCNVA